MMRAPTKSIVLFFFVALVASTATALDDIIAEIASSNLSERGSRIDDKRSEAAMEERKTAGYF